MGVVVTLHRPHIVTLSSFVRFAATTLLEVVVVVVVIDGAVGGVLNVVPLLVTGALGVHAGVSYRQDGPPGVCIIQAFQRLEGQGI